MNLPLPTRYRALAMRSVRRTLLGVCASLVLPVMATAADYRDDIDYVSLAAELGVATPQGVGVPVSHIEAPDGSNAWMPQVIINEVIINAEFSGKTILDKSGAVPDLYSSHATTVASFFYGNLTSTAKGITSIAAYEVNDWIRDGFLRTPAMGNGAQPLNPDSRVANHSWVGSTTSGGATYDPAILRRVDWVIGRDDVATVVGLNNGGSNYPLLASSFNAIAVGRTDAGHATGTVNVGLSPYDPLYVAGRARPDLVAPAAVTSVATPMVGAAAALLVQVGNSNAALSTDPVSQSRTNRAGDLIRNAERVEVIKAALMAGALRSTSGNVAAPDITDYRVAAGNRTTNGLDRRFGAGQLNVANSYRIIAAGEKNSIQDSSAGGGQAGLQGLDFDPHFGGGSGTNTVGTYYFPVQSVGAKFTFALVWNLSVDGGSAGSFDDAAELFNLDAFLYDVTNAASPVLVASSASTIDNTENLSVDLLAGRAYSVQVKRAASQANFDWHYGAAWQIVAQLSDADSDGVADNLDNCVVHANADQFDADNDGYGNRCDGDLNNNLATNSQDTVVFRGTLGTSNALTDLNHSGTVNAQDTTIFRSLLGSPPGPSALAP